MLEIKPIFKIINTKTIAVTIVVDGKLYPIAVLDSPNPKHVYQKIINKIDAINISRKKDNLLEINIEPTFQAEIDSMMVSLNIEFEEYKKNHKEEKETKKSKKQSINCSTIGCGGIANKKKNTYVCGICGAEYTSDGELTEPPWGQEPIPDSWIQCTGEEVFELTTKYWQDHMVYQNEIEYMIDALWDAHTYFMKEFSSTSYRAYLGAGNAKGKTRALEIHSLLCFRPAFQSRPSDACVKKIIDDGGTLLLDQAEDTFYERWGKTVQYNIFTSGYKRGIKIGQLSSIDKYNYDCKEVFGAKAFCMQEDGKRDYPINRRTIKSKMQKGIPKNKILDKETAKKIRNMFYYLRNNIDTKNINKDTDLDSEIAELIDPLIITCRILGLSRSIEDKLYVYALELEDELLNEVSDTLPVWVLEGISATFEKNATESPGVTTPKIVANWINENYEPVKPYSPEKVGNIMKDMGLQCTRQNTGKKYNFYDPKNMEALSKAQEQYKPDSIATKLAFEEKRLADEGYIITDNMGGTIYEKFVRYNRLHDFLKKNREEKVSQNINVVYDDSFEDVPENPDDEIIKQQEKYLKEQEEIAKQMQEEYEESERQRKKEFEQRKKEYDEKVNKTIEKLGRNEISPDEAEKIIGEWSHETTD